MVTCAVEKANGLRFQGRRMSKEYYKNRMKTIQEQIDKLMDRADKLQEEYDRLEHELEVIEDAEDD